MASLIVFCAGITVSECRQQLAVLRFVLQGFSLRAACGLTRSDQSWPPLPQRGFGSICQKLAEVHKKLPAEHEKMGVKVQSLQQEHEQLFQQLKRLGDSLGGKPKTAKE